ncbi:6570_t:CDS:2 [Cetraspora pellucida]|uniref:6570_t:CDS:1 n=1 Tax=Cetraspora pellucida TaxID=1433469 RepID=A0ACA9KF32_9GLOM|nr:6570_t:CDS:2 [Cetraspora pellucida]
MVMNLNNSSWLTSLTKIINANYTHICTSRLPEFEFEIIGFQDTDSWLNPILEMIRQASDVSAMPMP